MDRRTDGLKDGRLKLGYVMSFAYWFGTNEVISYFHFLTHGNSVFKVNRVLKRRQEILVHQYWSWASKLSSPNCSLPHLANVTRKNRDTILFYVCVCYENNWINRINRYVSLQNISWGPLWSEIREWVVPRYETFNHRIYWSFTNLLGKSKHLCFASFPFVWHMFWQQFYWKGFIESYITTCILNWLKGITKTTL